MELFETPHGARAFFDNLNAPDGRALVYVPNARTLELLETHGPACANREAIGCNWQAAGSEGLCQACAMTRTAPDLALPANQDLWAEAEAAKRWVIANMMRWGLFTQNDPNPAPKFDFLSEQTRDGSEDVIMGHKNNLITIAIQEADPAIREGRRQGMDERYRTMIGHIRHELAHALFLRLSTRDNFLTAFRNLFGDERADYGVALDRHYSDGPPDGWQGQHLTAYASAHPHEDWAETCAHFLHLVDMVDSARAAGLGHELPDAYVEGDVETLLDRAAALGIALNHVNRSMGLVDLYPFVFSPVTREKLTFVHAWLPSAAH